MAGPAFWGLCLLAGEIALGTLLLLGGRWAKVGWLGAPNGDFRMFVEDLSGMEPA